MRKTLALLALLLLPSTAFAIDIDKKWGLSAGIADDEGQLSLIRGTPRGAWIVDFNFTLFTQDIEEDDPTVNPDLRIFQQFSTVSIGPRMRRFARPDAKLSPYLDLFAHYVQSKQTVSVDNPTAGTGTSQVVNQMGAEFGLGLGVEFETAWNFNIAAHTDFLTVQYLNLSAKVNQTTDQSLEGTSWEIVGGFNPALFARVYF